MRVLVLSDIHNNIEHVRILRDHERNVYDVVIVAGDIGNRIADDFFSILDSFGCPVFCVYGNWDHDLIYKKELSSNCVLLHHNIEEVNGYFITGFSGCPSSWGNNPIYLLYKDEMRNRHSEVLSFIDKARQNAEDQKQEIEKKYQVEFDKLRQKTRDRRRKGYKAQVRRLEEREAKEINKADKQIEKVYSSKEYKIYEEDCIESRKGVLSDNRVALFDKIHSAGIPEDKLIIVTHERMYKIAEEGVSPLLHIFGHAHEYKFSKFKGTYYLNAAAIDNGFSELFGRTELLPEGYCDIDISSSGVLVRRKLLQEERVETSG